jgi:hypothetical protein
MAKSKVKMMIWSLVSVVSLAGPITIWMIIAHADRTTNTDFFGVAVKGYDTVAYFTEGRARKGDSQFEAVWQDAHWLFANAEHRDLFKAHPELYAPQYGGFCASYMAEGGIAEVDPEAWIIVDGKLYLNWSKEGRDELMEEDAAETIRKADEEWAKQQRRS